MTTPLRAGALDLEVLRRGAGPALLLLHDVAPISKQARFIETLAHTYTVIAPSHPGFGRSPRPADFDTVYDLVNLYHDVLDAIDASRVAVIGFGFGGWIATELAVAGARKLDRLVLVDTLGAKFGGREERDFVHLFNTDPKELLQRAWHDPARRPSGIHGLGWQATIDESMTDAELVSLARNWDSLCLYGWKPHMYNPQLAYWLRRIAVPTLVLWGESDRIATPEYGRQFAQRIPGAAFQTIAAAGHHPELEQPDAFAGCVSAFLEA